MVLMESSSSTPENDKFLSVTAALRALSTAKQYIGESTHHGESTRYGDALALIRLAEELLTAPMASETSSHIALRTEDIGSNRELVSSSTNVGNGKCQWFAVFIGRRIGVFEDVCQVKAQVAGVPYSYRVRYNTRKDAVEAFLESAAAGKVHIHLGQGHELKTVQSIYAYLSGRMENFDNVRSLHTPAGLDRIMNPSRLDGSDSPNNATPDTGCPSYAARDRDEEMVDQEWLGLESDEGI